MNSITKNKKPNDIVQGIDQHGVIAYINPIKSAISNKKEKTSSNKNEKKSSNKKEKTSKNENYLDGILTGVKWQCVEYVRRWLIIVNNITFEQVDTAFDIWNIKYFIKLPLIHSIDYSELYKKSNQNRIEFVNIPYNSKLMPEVGSLLIYKKTLKNPYGHVAVVIKCDNSYAYIAEQNYSQNLWKHDFSRRINISKCSNLVGWKTRV